MSETTTNNTGVVEKRLEEVKEAACFENDVIEELRAIRKCNENVLEEFRAYKKRKLEDFTSIASCYGTPSPSHIMDVSNLVGDSSPLILNKGEDSSDKKYYEDEAIEFVNSDLLLKKKGEVICAKSFMKKEGQKKFTVLANDCKLEEDLIKILNECIRLNKYAFAINSIGNLKLEFTFKNNRFKFL